MADPARADADDEEQAEGRKPGWVSVQMAMVSGGEACALAIAELARSPHSGAAMAMVQATRAVLERLGDVARQRAFNDQMLEAEREMGYAAGMAAAAAARRACHLKPVPKPD